MAKEKILVVDDEESLCEILQFNLEIEGYDVDIAYSAEQALEMDIAQYNLILLDVMMGEMSGFKMAKLLKENPETSSIPIIFCTAKDSEDDTVSGLNIGADDYISKPFSNREVVARVKSALRRYATTAEQKKDILKYEGLEIDLQQKTCRVDNENVALTKKEFEILSLMLAHIGTIFTRDDILTRIWTNEVIVLDRTIDVNITRLRKKIKNYGSHIITRNGFGYGFES